MTLHESRIVPVILCGGAGTRLWPASRDARPKPFLPLVGGRSTFAMTLDRVLDPSLFDEPLVIANRNHASLVEEALSIAGTRATLVLEPEARDTAAAIAAAAEIVAARSPDALMLVLAADHLIRDTEGFRETVRRAARGAEAGKIVLFGIRPSMPATGYGYIDPGSPLLEANGITTVAAFVEKPAAAEAVGYIAAGYLWNSGNFMMRASVALDELAEFAPDILAAAAAAVEASVTTGRRMELASWPFGRARKQSFDRAVMEKTRRAAVITADFDWSDLGTWSSIWDSAEKDESGNVALGDVVVLDGHGNYVNADQMQVGIIGLDDIVVVESDGALLIAPRGNADSVKDLVAALKRQTRQPDDATRRLRMVAVTKGAA
jgi:mannose-1-phosphate guanylyltransferase / mannose-6-phosphate isomerase